MFLILDFFFLKMFFRKSSLTFIYLQLMPSFSQIVNSCWHLYFLLLKICAFFHGSKFRDFFPPLYTFLQISETSSKFFLLYITVPLTTNSQPPLLFFKLQKVTFRKPKTCFKKWSKHPPLNGVLEYSVMCIQHHLSLCSKFVWSHYRPRLQYGKDLQIFTWFHFCVITATRKICKTWLQITLEISNCR